MYQLRNFLLKSCAFLITTSFATQTVMATEFDKSCGVQVAFVSDSLKKHLLSVSLHGKNIKVTTDGHYLSSRDKSKEFVLKPGESFERVADHHSSLLLKLLFADSKLAKFSYEMKFDKRSFGHNTIDFDTGEVEIALKDAAAKPADCSLEPALISLAENKIVKAGFRKKTSKKETFADEEFFVLQFLKVGTDSKIASENQLPLTLMFKDCPDVNTCKQVTARLVKLLKGKLKSNSNFDDYYDFNFSAYVGKRAMFRKGKQFFIIVFYDEAQRKLLEESCYKSLK